MEGGCVKSGFLQKAGKHTFQAWRKRWFILRNDNIKYFTSAEDDDDSNLLGTIQIVDIQSVKEYNGKKHSFVIHTRSRTYYMAAKSDVERDDWVISIRNVSTNQRQVNDASSNIYAEIGCVNVNENNFSKGVYTQVQVEIDHTSSSSVESKISPNSELSIYETVGKVSKPVNIPSPQPKPRSHSDIALVDENTTISTTPNIRLVSEGIHYQPEQNFQKDHRVHSLLQNTSVNKAEMNDAESICNQIDEIFDGCIAMIENDDEDDDEEEWEKEDVPFNFPEPRDGNQIHAFAEIRKIAETSGQIDEEVDLAEVAKSWRLTFDGNEEHPAISLLSTYIKETS